VPCRNPHFSPDFYCGDRSGHVCCFALPGPPQHTVECGLFGLRFEFCVIRLESGSARGQLLTLANPEAFQLFAEGGGIDQKQPGRFLLVPIGFIESRKDQGLFVAPYPILER
jgi:hypothetical protein